jgi:hypothetical protein
VCISAVKVSVHFSVLLTTLFRNICDIWQTQRILQVSHDSNIRDVLMYDALRHFRWKVEERTSHVDHWYGRTSSSAVLLESLDRVLGVQKERSYSMSYNCG